jgi:NAD(P)-dependent dehydrogenase (short-subunit alcohol dehydrogenase family)
MDIQPVVLVTGAAAGIGRVIAEHFLAAGHRVFVCDADPSHVEAFARSHGPGRALRADVSDPAEVRGVFERIEHEAGRLDVLVNNAGIAGPVAKVEDIDPLDWDRTVAVDLNGTFYVTRLAVPMLKRFGGSIIIMASNVVFSGCPMRSPYTACKWALIGFTKTLAMELGSFGIRVNAVCPGSVEGARIDAVIERDAARRGRGAAEIRDLYRRQSSLRSFVTADDVANMVEFLASDAGRRISGQALAIDGHTESLASGID